MATSTRVTVGALVFAGTVFFRVPNFYHAAWAEALLMLAALVIVPLVHDLVADDADGLLERRLLTAATRLQLPAALLLVFAYAGGPDGRMALRAGPWACVLLLLAAVGVRRIVRRGRRPLAFLCRDAGLVYASVGAVWLMADRFGLRPLGFDAAIVLLTAVHFHFAGLVVPVLGGLAMVRFGTSRIAGLTGLAVILGVPAVAVGISASQLGLDPRVEVVAVLLMVAGGIGLAGLHLRLALRAGETAAARCFWGIAGFSLGAGMWLAALYGVRHFFHPWPWLDLPRMRAVHGSLNALGFGFCGVIGWWLVRSRAPTELSSD
jgi:hypothetical protein